MKEVTRNLLVGLFVLGSLAVAAILMVWFGEAPEWLGTGDWTLEVTGVREIRGIGEGTPVLLNGVEIGRVVSLDFVDREIPGRGVVICAKIKRDYSVPHGATAKIYGSMFGLGSGQINIAVEPGPPAPPLDRDEGPSIHGTMASMIREFIPEDFTDSFQSTVDHLGNLAEATTPVAESLAKLLEERTVDEVAAPDAAMRGITANLSTLIERLDDLVTNVNTVLGDENVQGDIKGVARDLKESSEGIKELVELWRQETQRTADNLNESIDRAAQKLTLSLGKTNEMLEKLDDAATNLAAASGQVSSGEGTVGRLLYDDRLYESGVLALQRLIEVLDRLERITGKIEQDGYITIGQTTSVGTFTKKFPVKTQDDGRK